MRYHNADVVRAALVPADVLDYFEVGFTERRGELVTRLCPECGERSRESVYVDTTSGAWHCKSHGCHGDLYALIADYAGLDVRRQFSLVVALGAKIAGIDRELTPDERDRLLARRRRREAERAERERSRLEAARVRMPFAWAAFKRRDARGESYIRRRGLDPTLLHARDLVRYTSAGEPGVVLRDVQTNEIVGVQYRRLVDEEPRQLALRGSQVRGATLAGRLSDLAAGGVAVITEGLIDTLTAHLAWPDSAIYGAPGADQLGEIAAVLAPLIAERCGVLLIVGDDDRAGRAAASRAIAAAERAGLRHVPPDAAREPGTVRVVDLGVGLDGRRHHDLNDAWRRSAWRWRWPTGGAL